MRWVYRILAVAMLVLAAPVVAQTPPACACTCLPRDEPAEFARADTVLVGTLIEIHNSDDPAVNPLESTTLVFEVETVHKGSATDTQSIRTATHSPTCGWSGDIGARYLILAKQSDNGLRTGLCSGNRLVSGTPSTPATPATPIESSTAPSTPAAPPTADDSGLPGSSEIPAVLIAVLAATLLAAGIFWRRTRQR